MSKSIHTFPARIRKTVRDPQALCTCGATASKHVNHLGPCTSTKCERWTWAPQTAVDALAVKAGAA